MDSDSVCVVDGRVAVGAQTHRPRLTPVRATPAAETPHAAAVFSQSPGGPREGVMSAHRHCAVDAPPVRLFPDESTSTDVAGALASVGGGASCRRRFSRRNCSSRALRVTWTARAHTGY